MVCQGASKARFRALKHENGIAGRTTIIVRVIACFQPLQNCQAEYFRQLLKPVTTKYGITLVRLPVDMAVTLYSVDALMEPEINYQTICQVACPCWMVTAKKYSTFPSSSPSYLDHMEPFQLDQNCNVPFFCPVGGTNVLMPGYSTCNFLSLSTSQQNVVGSEPSELLSPEYNISCPTENPYPTDSHFMLPHGLGLRVKTIDTSSAPEKRFLIFDRSGDQMSLFFSPLLSPQNKTSSTKAPTSASFPCEEDAARAGRQLLMKSLTGDENWDENHLTDEGDETGEDTEEINALLYSDSDDEYDNNENTDYDSEKDEVTSTSHSPFIIEEGYNKDKSFEELEREGASSDVCVKRQRLLYGKYRTPSLVSIGSPMKHAVSGNYKDDVESGIGDYNISHDNIDPNKREKKVKIRQALKILESILPGLISKDPLSIIDKAIVYLKSMKTKAKSLGVGYPGFKSAALA